VSDAANAVVEVVREVHAHLEPECDEERRDEPPGHEHPGRGGPDDDRG
jgi:hypothetical protein